MVRVVGVIGGIPEYKERKIFISGNEIKIYSQKSYFTKEFSSVKKARYFAEGAQAAYEKMGIYFEIIDSEKTIYTPFRSNFVIGDIEESEKMTIRVLAKEKRCEILINLDNCFFKKEIDDDIKTAKAFAHGFNYPYSVSLDLSLRIISEDEPQKEFNVISLTPFSFGK